MSTVSVPLPDDMFKKLKNLVDQGIATNMSDAIRRALKAYLEDQAVEAVLKAKSEPSLEGDLDDLARKI